MHKVGEGRDKDAGGGSVGLFGVRNGDVVKE
jgi:hypothetical protein